MKLVITCLIIVLWISEVAAQSISFSFSDYQTLTRSRNIHGVSGAEYIPCRREWHLVGDRGQHYFWRNLNGLTDWSTQPDSVSETGLFFEAVRYDALTDTYYFAVENSDESYVGFYKHRLPRAGETYERLALPAALPAPQQNKGIEALALTDSALWVVPEAGAADQAIPNNNTVHFYRFKKQKNTVAFDAAYAYEIDRNVCPNEALGGISEIIDVPGDETRLLVLERCYQKPTSVVKLYEAHINQQTHTITKVKDHPAFDFNAQSGYRVDNLEAMTWMEDATGQRVLVLMSDDNGGRAQWTQIVWLTKL